MSFGEIKEIVCKQDSEGYWFATIVYEGLPSLRLNFERGPSWISQFFSFSWDVWPDAAWLEADVDNWLEENKLEEWLEDWQ